MKWNELNNIGQIDQLDIESQTYHILIFKHSTRCSISDTALARIERGWQNKFDDKIKPYYLDLIKHREISNVIAEKYQVNHESPQILLIEKGKCIYHASHTAIQAKDMERFC